MKPDFSRRERGIGFSVRFLTEKAHMKEFKVMELLIALQLDLLASKDRCFTVGVTPTRGCSRSLAGDLLLSLHFSERSTSLALCAAYI